MTGINHQPFIIRFVDQNFQKFFPYTFSAPSDEPLMNAPPLPVIRRQVTPRRSGPQHPEYCIDKTTVILGDSSPLPSLSRQMGFQQCPYIIAYVMSVIGCFHLFLSCLFMMLPFYHNPLTLCRRHLDKSAEKQKETAAQAESNYLKGRADGSKLTYELCAKWIKEIIEEGEVSQ